MKKLIKKSIFSGVSLAVILLMSVKLILACTSVICDSGTESNICAIADNLIVAESYFHYTLTVFIASLVVYFLSKKNNALAPVICLISITLPTILHYLNGSDKCDFSTTKVIKWLFCFSMIAFTFQLISWIVQKSEVKKFH